jgi:hypothetical protein
MFQSTSFFERVYTSYIKSLVHHSVIRFFHRVNMVLLHPATKRAKYICMGDWNSI